MMQKVVVGSATSSNGEAREFVLKIEEGKSVGAEEYFCEIECDEIFSRKRKVYGQDINQARELAGLIILSAIRDSQRSEGETKSLELPSEFISSSA